MFTLTVILVILLVTLLLMKTKYLTWVKEYIRYRRLLSKLPTARGKRFLFGHSLGFLSASYAEAWNLSRTLLQNMPPVFTMSMGPFITLVAIQGPDEFELLTSSMKHLEKSMGYFFFDYWLENGLLTSKGSRWQQRRKILTPAFHFSILLDFINLFNRETINFIANIEKNHSSQTVNITPLLFDFTLATISETSMGTKLDVATQEGRIYKKAVTEIGEVSFQRFIRPWLWYRPIFNMTTYRTVEKNTLEILHGFSNYIIAKREQGFQSFDENFDASMVRRKYPLLDLLLNAKFKNGSIDNRGIREEVDTFMFEGHDTTAMCLSFTTMLLANHKDIQDQVYQEIISIVGEDLANEPSYADLQSMHLLERCIKESLRLYPVVTLIGRKTSEDIPTKYGIIPRGSHTFTDAHTIHMNPDHWPNPEVFDPSRHLPENSQNRHPFAFIPFSAGPRNCIGQRFAMLEMKAFYCGVMRKFLIEPVDTPATVQLYHNFVLRPLGGIKVKFVQRSR